MRKNCFKIGRVREWRIVIIIAGFEGNLDKSIDFLLLSSCDPGFDSKRKQANKKRPGVDVINNFKSFSLVV